MNIRCKKCNGTGKLPLNPRLELVRRAIDRDGSTAAEIARKLAKGGVSMTVASILMRLKKLEAHDLVSKVSTDDGWRWGRK